MKKSQTSLFFIVSVIAILIIILVFFSLDSEEYDTEIKQLAEVSDDADSLRSYMHECTYEASKQTIAFFGLQGGELKLDSPLLFFRKFSF